MGQTKEQRIIKQLNPKFEPKNSIATGMFLPNHSGVSDKQIKRNNEIRHTKWFGSIQAAIDDLPSTGGTVFIDAGTYLIDTAITLKSNLLIIGEGDLSILKKNSNVRVFETESGANNITIRDILIDGSDYQSFAINTGSATGDHYTGYPNVSINHSNLIIKNVHFKDIDEIAIIVCSDNCVIENCFFDNVFNAIDTAKHLNESTSQDITILNNIIVNESYDRAAPSTEYGEAIDINTHGNGKAIIIGNRIKGFDEDGIDCNCRYATISDNIIELDNTETRESHGINISTEATVHSRITCSNNIILGVNSTAGIGINLDTSCEYVNLSSNTIICDGGSSIGIKINANVDNAVLMGNSIDNAGTEINDSGANTLIFANIGASQVDGSFTTTDGKTVTVTNGIITSIV